MKTLKIAVIATLVAFAFVSVANANRFTLKPGVKVVNLYFKQAVQMPELVMAMYNQLDEVMLFNNVPEYTFTVTHDKVVYNITGTLQQWTSFFENKWLYLKYTFNKKPKE